MTIVVTVAEVQELAGADLPDIVIQGFIDQGLKAEDCLEASYSADTAKTIVMLYAAHLADISDGGSIKTERASNGASVTFNNSNDGRGLWQTPFGRSLEALDTNHCMAALTTPDFGIWTVG